MHEKRCLNSIGSDNVEELFQMPRGKWQTAFVNFLRKSGFDFDGDPADESLNQYIRSESYPVYRYDEVEMDPKEIRMKGRKIGDEYDFNGVRYLITGTAKDNVFDDLFEDRKKNGCKDTAEFVYRVIKTEKVEKDVWFENDVFLIRSYFWGNSEEISKLPNFVYKPENLVVKWYKHPLRGAYCNQDIDYAQFLKMLEECRISLQED